MLTYDDALKVMKAKVYSDTNSWTRDGRYFVRDAGAELKELLKQFGMTAEQWREKLQTT